MKDLIEYIARSLVDDADAVQVDALSDEDQSYELHVAAADRGKVIGRKGRTAHAIRTILAAACEGENVRPSLEIVD
ncbi:MAG: KH domain-containing protein [Deltaproteobacteria bacterium]|jgi:hypothetical protein|nr:KH domain-containing protein [Deltaproteobacteria bacterium]MBT6489719.1 KH domain-containing protein [Deltaproteobacteria bacterium]